MDLRLVLELRTGADVVREWAHLSCGGAFVRGVSVEANLTCVLVLIGPGGDQLELTGKTVYSAADGVGLQLDGFDGALREQVQGWMTWVSAAEPDKDEETEEEKEGEEAEPEEDAPVEVRNVFQGLRNLSIVDQLKVAREGDTHERMALERIYGKTVWEAILRNPRVTHPEVARIARMGALPRPLLDTICGNTAWLRSPEVRRALLFNLRLGADLIPKILRLLPRHELRLVPAQTAYPAPVREVARRMIKEMEKQT